MKHAVAIHAVRRGKQSTGDGGRRLMQHLLGKRNFCGRRNAACHRCTATRRACGRTGGVVALVFATAGAQVDRGISGDQGAHLGHAAQLRKERNGQHAHKSAPGDLGRAQELHARTSKLRASKLSITLAVE